MAATKRRRRVALTTEDRESQLIDAAVNLAEKQLLEGTASSQVITHYLKLGSVKNQLEMDKLRHENELLRAKTEVLESQKRNDEVYQQALNAFMRYSGSIEAAEDVYVD